MERAAAEQQEAPIVLHQAGIIAFEKLDEGENKNPRDGPEVARDTQNMLY